MKRNYVKLQDNVVLLLQERDEEKKDRKMILEIVKEVRDELKLIVIKEKKIKKKIIINTSNLTISESETENRQHFCV